MERYNFGDGRGMVPAHRHTNPDASLGGWVDDTASVGESVSVGEGARVGAWASVGEGARVGAWASVGEGARVGALARVGEGVSVGARARVGEGVSVGACARVGEGVSIGAWASVGEGAHVGKEARVGEGVSVGAWARVGEGVNFTTSPLYIIGSKYTVFMLSNSELQIGCQHMPIAQWKERGMAIAEREGFSAAEVEEYRLYIELAEKLYPVPTEA